MGVKVAQSISSYNIIDMIDISEDYSIMEMNVAGGWIGKSIGELEFRSKYGINVIAIRIAECVEITLGTQYVLDKEDVLVIIGKNENIDKVRVLS